MHSIPKQQFKVAGGSGKVLLHTTHSLVESGTKLTSIASLLFKKVVNKDLFDTKCGEYLIDM